MLLQELLDNLSTGIIGLDASLRILVINPAAEVLLQASSARLVGQPADMLNALPPVWIQTLQQVLAERQQIVRRGLLLQLPQVTDTQVDITITPLLEDGPLSIMVEVHTVDRLLRISRDESLMNAHETTRTVIRGLAHEIKNPLAGVRGAAQLLARELPEGTLTEYTVIIIQEADRLRDLVDRLLGPNGQLTMQSLNVHEVLEHVCQLIRVEAAGRVSLGKDYDPSLPNIIGDRAQLVQAVLNIMRNALQAMADQLGGDLKVSTRSERQFTIGNKRHRLVCRIDIQDNGPGIPEELRHSIFVPMISGRAEGSGLGLSISQSIVNRHGGLLNYQSEPGCTRFSLYLPLETDHA